MSAFRRLAVALAAAAGLSLGGCGMGLFAGKPPTNLGAKDGRLAPCPSSPNCVSSQADPADRTHAIAPLALEGDPARAWHALRDLVAGWERARIVAEQEGYLRAEFTTKLMGFVDDVEFLLDPGARVIHVRSASRLGHRDFGVNRERVEAIRGRFAAGGS